MRHGEASELGAVRRRLEQNPELLRAHEQLEGYRDLLTSVLAANLAQVTVRSARACTATSSG